MSNVKFELLIRSKWDFLHLLSIRLYHFSGRWNLDYLHLLLVNRLLRSHLDHNFSSLLLWKVVAPCLERIFPPGEKNCRYNEIKNLDINHIQGTEFSMTTENWRKYLASARKKERNISPLEVANHLFSILLCSKSLTYVMVTRKTCYND